MRKRKRKSRYKLCLFTILLAGGELFSNFSTQGRAFVVQTPPPAITHLFRRRTFYEKHSIRDRKREEERRGHETTQEFPPFLLCQIPSRCSDLPKKRIIFGKCHVLLPPSKHVWSRKGISFSWPIIATSSLKKSTLFLSPRAAENEQNAGGDNSLGDSFLSDRRRRCLFLLFLFYFLGLCCVLSVGLTT